MGFVKKAERVLGGIAVESLIAELKEGYSFIKKFKKKLHNLMILFVIMFILQIVQSLAIFYLIFKLT